MAQDDLEGKPGGKFLRWALTWGRRIIVITELVVISAFLSRFWLDTEVANLSDIITKDKAIVETSAQFEQQFRSVSDRLAKAEVLEKEVSPLVAYDSAMQLIPQTISLVQINTDGKTVSFSGGGSEEAIAQLVTSFKNSPQFTNVFVARISKSDINPAVNFSLTADHVPINNL